MASANPTIALSMLEYTSSHVLEYLNPTVFEDSCQKHIIFSVSVLYITGFQNI